MAPMINSYLSVTEENFKTSIASFCVLIVYPDAWLEDARQGATPGQRAPQPLLKKRVSGLGFLEALQRDLVQKGFRDLGFRLPKPECFW